jgi:hypothetical protein
VRPPELPDGIDWLWIISSKAPPIRTVYWERLAGWSEMFLSGTVLVVEDHGSGGD